VDAIKMAKALKKIHGMPKAEILNRQADGTGSKFESYLTCQSGMPEDNPFKSKAQQRYLFAKKPKLAKEFAAKTKSFKSLPERVAK
jgi:hypothetical protein